MYSHVDIKAIFSDEALPTMMTSVRLFSCIYPLVSIEDPLGKTCITKVVVVVRIFIEVIMR